MELPADRAGVGEFPPVSIGVSSFVVGENSAGVEEPPEDNAGVGLCVEAPGVWLKVPAGDGKDVAPVPPPAEVESLNALVGDLTGVGRREVVAEEVGGPGVGLRDTVAAMLKFLCYIW